MKQLPRKPIHQWKALDELFPKLCSELQTEAMVLVYVKKNVWPVSLRNTVHVALGLMGAFQQFSPTDV